VFEEFKSRRVDDRRSASTAPRRTTTRRSGAAPRTATSSRSASGSRARPAGSSDVDAAVDWTFENFDVVRFYGDPPWWQDQMGRWAATHNSPPPPKPRSPPVIEFWTNVDSKMARRLRRAPDGDQRPHDQDRPGPALDA
jgi:hypothetical protein